VLDWYRRWRTSRTLERRAIPDELWRLTLAHYPFLDLPDVAEARRLRELSTLFLATKEFTGVRGLVVDDAMAVAIAAQACLPVLNRGLDEYDGFVGIVVHEDLVVAKREHMDDDGIVHRYDEEVSGEAMHGGPVMLSWRDVDLAGESADEGYNVVIHEFVHVLDMRNGDADGIPTLANRAAVEEWVRVLSADYEAFCERVDADEDTLLDPYAAQGMEEYFAVASEAFFVSPWNLLDEHPSTYRLLRDFFQQDPASRTARSVARRIGE
jgi:Mlc titration factor MtfA (ptsG expression regulator)